MDHKKKPGALEMYISSLSVEDRENYKDIIEEFSARDARISKDCEDARRSIQRLESMEIELFEKLNELKIASNRLLKNTADLYLNLVHKEKMHS